MRDFKKAIKIYEYLTDRPLENKVTVNNKDIYANKRGVLCIKMYNETKERDEFVEVINSLNVMVNFFEDVDEDEFVKALASLTLKSIR
ncbi:MAG: hypothetical protein ACOCRO_04055 [Halanaerobiales bacterium]